MFAPSRLDFKQSSLHHVAQVSRNSDFNTFSSLFVFPTCYCPLCLSTPGKSGDL